MHNDIKENNNTAKYEMMEASELAPYLAKEYADLQTFNHKCTTGEYKKDTSYEYTGGAKSAYTIQLVDYEGNPIPYDIKMVFDKDNKLLNITCGDDSLWDNEDDKAYTFIK